jgi:hypothetical protein
MFRVSSVVHVSSIVTARDDAFGCTWTTPRFNTAAQCATLSLASEYERGYFALTTGAATWIEYVSVGATPSAPVDATN